jgi:cytochrome P450
VDYAFFLLMTLYPEIQATAKAEINAVVGDDRLPTLADRDRLPYVCALISEVFRYSLVVATPARLCSADDFYGKYFIPKGSYIFPNTW